MTDIYANVVWSMSQTPFGIATVNEDPDGNGVLMTNNFRFPGQYYDAETGLNDNYYRTYNPATGRYTQHDPIGLDGGMNPFAYVGGNPIGLIDFFGLCSCKYKSKAPYDGENFYYGQPHYGGLWYTARLDCIYTCTDDSGCSEDVHSTQESWYTNASDTRNGVCEKALNFVGSYDHAGFFNGYTESKYGDFNPIGLNIPELEVWGAKNHK